LVERSVIPLDLARYAELFLTESREHLSAINHLLLELERAPTASEPVTAIFRAVHSIKGMSATMGYAAVAALSHEMETLLDRVRQRKLSVTPELLDACFAAADALDRTIEEGAQAGPDDADVVAVVSRLRAIGGTTEPRTAAHRQPDMGTGEATGQLVRVMLELETPLKGARAFRWYRLSRRCRRSSSTAHSPCASTRWRTGRPSSERYDRLEASSRYWWSRRSLPTTEPRTPFARK
jgi:two-component system chemotaxis sensor kinase CheA